VEFLEQVDQARRCTERFNEKIILMGAVPDLPETDYGWVQLGKRLPSAQGGGFLRIHEVAGFREKPGPEEAQNCFEQGHLWNTMIVVTKIKALWRLGKRLLPEVAGKFESFQRMLLGSRAKKKREEETGLAKLYRHIPSFDFSGNLLTQGASQLAVMPLEGVLWSDWGRPERVFESLRRIGREATFLEKTRRWQIR
jgi:mannose-1-phosphate guanylyltransferase